MKKIILLLICLALTAASCVKQDQIDSMNRRIMTQGQRLDRLDGGTGGEKGVLSTQAELWAEIEQLRTRLAAMEGKMDELNRRFTAPAPETVAPFPLDAPREDIFIDSGMSPDEARELLRPDEALPATGEDPAVTLYNEARAQYNAKNFEAAKALWDKFAQVHPKHDLTPNALFWQGECFYQMQKYGDAALAYEKVKTLYPKSVKYPAALLKQGLSFIKLGKTQPGKLLLNELVKRFPDSREAAIAVDFLKNPD